MRRQSERIALPFPTSTPALQTGTYLDYNLRGTLTGCLPDCLSVNVVDGATVER